MSANSVNCETIKAAPRTSTRLRFIFPASSANTRRSMILSARRRTVVSSSSRAAPTNNTKPWPMVARCCVPPSPQLTDDLLDHAHADDLTRGQLELLRGLDLARVVAPHDRGGRLWRGDRVDRVLEHDHAVGHPHAERAPASALTDHRRNYRDRDAKPLHDRLRDRRR